MLSSNRQQSVICWAVADRNEVKLVIYYCQTLSPAARKSQSIGHSLVPKQFAPNCFQSNCCALRLSVERSAVLRQHWVDSLASAENMQCESCEKEYNVRNAFMAACTYAFLYDQLLFYLKIFEDFPVFYLCNVGISF